MTYVDDIVIIGNDVDGIKELKAPMHSSFHIKDLRDLKYFLRVEVLQDDNSIHLSQCKYILELIDDMELK